MHDHARWALRIALAVLAAASAWARGAEEGNMAVFMMSDKDETCIQVAAGQAFAIRFQASPGTGYSWEFAAELDAARLEFLEEKTGEEERPRLGGRVFVSWTFRALAAGETEIAMKYVRPWEKGIAPVKTHVFKVKIH